LGHSQLGLKRTGFLPPGRPEGILTVTCPLTGRSGRSPALPYPPGKEKTGPQRAVMPIYDDFIMAVNNLDTSAENLQAAESRVRDLDMAEEMMEFTKANILNQAATAMLAQANMAPQTVLQLLG
jgi:hypothetical protein